MAAAQCRHLYVGQQLYICLRRWRNVPAARMDGRPVLLSVPSPGTNPDVLCQSGRAIDAWCLPGIHHTRNQVFCFGHVSVELLKWSGSPTPTPLPTQTPSPDINFSANPTTINAGQCSTLTWQVENVERCLSLRAGTAVANYPVAGSGTRTVCLHEQLFMSCASSRRMALLRFVRFCIEVIRPRRHRLSISLMQNRHLSRRDIVWTWARKCLDR